MKQTPEQAEVVALLAYIDGLVVNLDGKGYNHLYVAAKHSIIKSFQDRERLLEALESIANNKFTEYDHEAKANEMSLIAIDAIKKAKS